jgi:glutathione synthase/RimK-type ligase-like ATP-grasp enzyme
MNKIKTFDVLVVYTSTIAASASSNNVLSPFQLSKNRTNYNESYSYFLKTCEKNNLESAFVTSKDITGGGTASCYWLYKNNKWTKVNQPCYSQLIFEKLSPVNSKQEHRLNILFSDPKVRPFNDPAFFSLFYDKQKTYRVLQDFAIPTVAVVNKNPIGIHTALNKIRVLTAAHPHASDFSKRFILKDRYGSGGNNVYLVDSLNPQKNILNLIRKNKNISFILQPFAQFNTGYIYNKSAGFIDIRMIYLGQRVVQVYIRRAKKGDFRCNEHQGGELHYITLKEVPLKVRMFAKRIAQGLNVDSELYALDLVVSNNGNVFLMEGNIRPGIDWNLALKKNERMAKKLIRVIVGEIAKRATPTTPKFISPVSDQNIYEPLTL